MKFLYSWCRLITIPVFLLMGVFNGNLIIKNAYAGGLGNALIDFDELTYNNERANLVLALSIEFPTFGRVYTEPKYSNTKKYLGYWNPYGCYTYSDTDEFFSLIYLNTDSTPPIASDFECSNAYSGNFLNYAGMVAMDVLRLSLSGGDRIIDTPNQTVLQRSVILGGFYGSYNYPEIRVENAVAAKVVPFNLAGEDLYVYSCLDHLYFRSKPGGSCLATPTPDDLKLARARVEVCSNKEGASRPDLCHKYPTDVYKPIGELQRNAERLNVSIFSYLLVSDPVVYGGVLRAPSGYIGPSGNNPNKEWDEQTGVFIDNPRPMPGYTNSGVMNALNKSSRTGNLKAFDPVGELYYEAVRYLQGKQPTALAFQFENDPSRVFDNTPILHQWDDPVKNECQKNYILLIGDENNNQDTYLPGNSGHLSPEDAYRAIEEGDPDSAYWTNLISSFETNGGQSYTDSKGRPQAASGNLQPDPRNAGLADSTFSGSSERRGFYFAGVAYWANTQAFRTDMPASRVKTIVVDVDEGGNSKYFEDSTRGRTPPTSSLWIAGKYGGFDNNDFTGNPFSSKNSWRDSARKHLPDYQNIPKNYFLASDPEAMRLSLQSIFANIVIDAGFTSSGAVSANGIDVYSGKEFLYVPSFNSGDWSGTVQGKLLSEDASTSSVSVSSGYEWDANEILTGNATTPPIAPASRNIYTLNKARGTSVPFTYSNLENNVQTAFNIMYDGATALPDKHGNLRVEYLRGDRTQETIGVTPRFRKRKGVMGDVINSIPVYKAGPSQDIISSAPKDYNQFVTQYKDRTPTVYVGSNDGMLHAFDAETGKELFAYVPRAIVDSLPRLSSLNYTHKAFVDGSPVVADAQIANKWGSVLVSGFGGGAQGVFALDVTQPDPNKSGSTVGSNLALWEFTDADDADVGNISAAPKIVKINRGTPTKPNHLWYAMFSSGYNNYRQDGYSPAPTNMRHALFALDLSKPISSPWVLGSNYFKWTVDTPIGASADGLSMPSFATGVAGEAIAAYAGDLRGNVWRFDLSASAFAAGSSSAGGGARLFFTAQTGAGTAQPIGYSPVVVRHPKGGHVVLFGTGKLVQDSSSTSSGKNSIYAVWDNHSTTRLSTLTRNNLQVRTTSAVGNSVTVSGSPFFMVDDNGDRYGWFFDFASPNEQLIGPPVFDLGVFAFNTSEVGQTACSTGGKSRNYMLNPLLGTPFGSDKTGYVVSDGLLSSPILVRTGVVEKVSGTAVGQSILSTKITSIGAGGAVSVIRVQTMSGIMSQRTLVIGK